MCSGLVNAQPFHKPTVLLWRQAAHLGRTSRPLEAAGFQALVQQHKTISLPIECLDSVTPPTTEQEQRCLNWIEGKLTLDDACQTIYATAQVGVPAGDVDGTCAVEVVQHDNTTLSIVRTVAESAPLRISTRTEPEWMTAAISARCV